MVFVYMYGLVSHTRSRTPVWAHNPDARDPTNQSKHPYTTTTHSPSGRTVWRAQSPTARANVASSASRKKAPASSVLAPLPSTSMELCRLCVCGL